MNKAAEILAKIKAVFAGEVPAVAAADAVVADAAAADAAPKEYTLMDGNVVLIDKLETGGIVTAPDGTPVAAATYTLADGTAIIVGEAGVITLVTAPGALAADAAMAAPAAFNTDGSVSDALRAAIKAEVAALTGHSAAQFAAQDSTRATEVATLKASNERLTAAFTQVVELVEEIMKEPATGAVTPANTAMAENPMEAKFRRGEALRAAAKNAEPKN